MFYQTLAQVAKLFLFLLTGFILAKKEILPDQTAKCFSLFLVWVSQPALYLYTFSTRFNVGQLAESVKLMAVSLVGLVVTLLLSRLIRSVIIKDDYAQKVFTYSVCVPNYGSVGYVLVQALFGEAVLLQYQIFVTPITIYVLTAGYAMLLDRKTCLKSLLNPMIVALLVGMVLGLLQIKLPVFLQEALISASDCIGPISMILTGCVIAQFDLKKVLSLQEVYTTVILRMLLLPALVIAVSLVIPIPRKYVSMLLIFHAMPCGLNSVVFPSTVGKDCSFGAGLAVISNTVALFTIPLFLSYLA